MSAKTIIHWPSRIASFLLLVSAVLVPIFFLPGVIDPGNWSKRILVGIFALAFVALWSAQTLLSKRALITLSKTSLFFLLFAGVTAVSALFTNNALYHLINFPVTWLALAVFVIFGSTMAREVRWSGVLKALLIPATLVILIALLQFTPLALSEIFNRIFEMSYPKSLSFSPAESFLGILTFVIPVSLAALFQTVESSHDSDSAPIYKIWSGILLLLSLVIAFVGWSNQATRPFILPWGTGWTIAVEAFKTPQTLLLGFGPNNFLNAFHQLRGLNYNLQDFWAVRFATSSTEFLTLLTTSGVLAIGALFGAAKSALPLLRMLKSQHFSLVIYLILHGIAFFTLPFTPVLWFTFALGSVMLLREALLLRSEDVWVAELPSSIRSPWLTPVVSTVLIAGSLAAVAVFMVAPVRSNYLLGASLKPSETGNAEEIYNTQALAMNLTPFHPEYRRAFASTSFSIIQALSQQAQEQERELTQDEQELSLNLLQQAINEARNAVALDPASTESWELLANIYTNVLTVEGAPDWAVAARTQAIQTDPTNPELRVSLGQLYAQLSQPENALQFYEQAIQLNPRWVQPYYLFGDTALALENGAAAATAFQRTLELLDPASQERAVVQDKLRAAQELATTQASAAAELRESGEQPAQPTQETDPAVDPGTQTDTTQTYELPTQPEQPTTPEVNPEPAGFSELL